MRIKGLLVICLILLMQQTVCAAKTTTVTTTTTSTSIFQKRTTRPGFHFSVWPIFFGGGTFSFSEQGPDTQIPGYALSGGLTFFVYEQNISFFSDVLYSYRAYDGFPQPLNYTIQESTADVALAVAFGTFYIGGYVQFPMSTMIKSSEMTLDEFDGISRSPSFSGMVGMRTMGKHLGFDVRLILGQGPGQFLGKEFGDHWLGQLSVGVTGGF